MRQLFENILVLGHHNPDTDASTAAYCYAELLNQLQRYPEKAVGAVPGEFTPQTKFVFERAGCQLPLQIDNVSPRVGHILNSNPITIDSQERVGTAIETLVRNDISMLPIVGEQGQLEGVFSNRTDGSRFLLGLDPTPLWGTLLGIDDLSSLPGMTIVGDLSPVPFEDGELRIALDGDNQWRADCCRNDVVVCANASTIKSIPPEKIPATVVIVDPLSTTDSMDAKAINAKGTAVLHYSQSLPEFLRSLVMHIRLSSLSLPTGCCIGESDLIEDIRPLMESSHHALPVIADNNKLVGLVSHGDLEKKNRSKVILVDHFQIPQPDVGLTSSEVLEILDHHRVGDIQTGAPIRVNCRPVGSSCTIVAASYLESGVEISPEIATLLLGGIVADTLILTGPTTTDTDLAIAPTLAKIAGVSVQEFGLEVMVAGDDLKTSDPKDIWQRDQKQFSIRNQCFAVAQLETASLESLDAEKLDCFKQLVDNDKQSNMRMLSMLVLTDVIKGDSWLCCSE